MPPSSLPSHASPSSDWRRTVDGAVSATGEGTRNVVREALEQIRPRLSTQFYDWLAMALTMVTALRYRCQSYYQCQIELVTYIDGVTSSSWTSHADDLSPECESMEDHTRPLLMRSLAEWEALNNLSDKPVATKSFAQTRRNLTTAQGKSLPMYCLSESEYAGVLRVYYGIVHPVFLLLNLWCARNGCSV